MKTNSILCFTLFLFLALHLRAQCTFDLNCTTTHSACLASGSIEVILSGTDVDLNNVHISLSDGSVSNVNNQKFTGLPPGDYEIIATTVCKGTTTKVSKTSKVSITSDYNELVAYIADPRKTLNCKPTGKIPIVIMNGSAPYTLSVSAPAGYTGSKSYTINTAGTFELLDNLPDGLYQFTVTDACNSSLPLSENLQKVISDFPTEPFYNYLYPTDPAGVDCKKSRALIKWDLNASDLTYYWDHRDQYYEVAFTSDGSMNWQSVSLLDYQDVSLAHSYKQLRDGIPASVYMRLKGTNCSQKVEEINPYDIYFDKYILISCVSYQMVFKPYASSNPHSLICYPYQWSLLEEGVVIETGVGIDEHTSQTTKELSFNKNYEIIVVDKEGTNHSYTYTNSGTFISGVGYAFSPQACMPDIGKNYLAINGFYDNGDYLPISLGTKIEFVSGPQTPTHPFITITESIKTCYPFSLDFKTLEYLNLKAGSYFFNIYDECGNPPKEYEMIIANYEIKDFSYTSQETCDGLRVYPTGRMHYDNYPTNTYFKLIQAPEGVDISNSILSYSENGSFVLPKTGHYTLSIGSYTWCEADTIGIDYVRENFTFSHRSAYSCSAGGIGRISIQAKNGVLPYTYELWQNGNMVLSNSSGSFQHGTNGDTYTIKVNDACGRSFSTDVQVINLKTQQAISGSELLCVGDTIFLNSMSLGSNLYTWTGPAGFISLQQNAEILNAQVHQSGTYTLTTLPLGCTDPLIQSINVLVYSPPRPTIADTIHLCQNANAAPLQAIPLAGHSIKWYDAAGVLLATVPEPITNSAITQVYYVSQIRNDLKCEGEKYKINVVVDALPTISKVSGSACVNASPLIVIEDAIKGYTYSVYPKGGTAAISQAVSTVNGTFSFSMTNPVTANVTYSVGVTSIAGCVSALTDITISVTQLALTLNVLPPYFSDTPYSVQLTSNASQPVFSFTGALPSGISISASGLISGTVPLAAGTATYPITITVTDSKGCTVDKQYELRTCEPAPTIPSQKLSYCVGETPEMLKATAISGMELRWYIGNQTTYTASATPATNSAGIQTFFVSQYNPTLQCEGVKNKVEVIVNSLPIMDVIISAPQICFNESPKLLLGQVKPNTTYEIYDQPQLTNPLATLIGNTSTEEMIELTSKIQKNTRYYIQLTDQITGCHAASAKEVEVDVTILEITPEQLKPYRRNTPVEVQLKTNAQMPHFSVLEGSLPRNILLNREGLLSGTVPLDDKNNRSEFTIQVEDQDGCKGSRVYTLLAEMFIPNAFSPNGDGYNDMFMEGKTVVIFDRLGVKIFEGQNGWDGTFKGQLAPPDSYFYRLQYKDDDGLDQIKTGLIVLLRSQN